MQRIIGLLDMDYFYAQIEEREHPEWKEKPIIVGMYSGRTPDSGAVATCNYAARKLGIRSALPLPLAKKLAQSAPESFFVPARMDFYRKVSQEIMAIIRGFSPAIETVGLDEAYFDLSEASQGNFEIAHSKVIDLKTAIQQAQGLSCSVGLGPNKLVAKMACDSRKPDGLTVIKPEQVTVFLYPLPIKKLLGVGPKTEEKLHELNVQTIEALSHLPLTQLVEKFGQARGHYLFDCARGVDTSPIESEWQKQQLSHIKTLPKDSADPMVVGAFLDPLSAELFKRIQKEKAWFKEVSFIAVSIRLENFTKNKTLTEESFSLGVIQETVKGLMRDFFSGHPQVALRRVGVRVGKLNRKNETVKNEKKQPRLSDFS